MIACVIVASPLLAQDPGGTATGTINDVTAATAGKPTLQEIGATRPATIKLQLTLCGLNYRFSRNVYAGWFCYWLKPVLHKRKMWPIPWR